MKVSALTPLLRPEAPERGQRDAAPRLRALLRRAHELGAHLHIDMESLDSREAVLELVLDLLAEPEFADGPSAGRRAAGLPARLAGDAGHDPRMGPPDAARAAARRAARQGRLLGPRGRRGAPARLERAGLRAQGRLRRELRGAHARGCSRRARSCASAIASHNLRSVAHAIARNRMLGGGPGDVEFQVLRGLGDDLGHALAASGLRVRAYCPVGDLVAGMAYLVRRLLENTANDSFLADQAHGVPLEQLLAAPADGAVDDRRPAAVSQRAGARAAPRHGAREARRRHWASCACRCACRVWIGGERREGEELVSTDPGRPERVVALAASATRRVRRRRRRRRARARSARGPRRRSTSAPPRCCAPPRGCASGAPRSPRWPCASAPSPGRRPMPTSARRSTSSSSTRAPRSSCRAARARRCCRSPASATRCATRRAGSAR